MRGVVRKSVAIAGLMLLTGCDRGANLAQGGPVGRTAPEFVVSDGVQSVDLAKLRGHVVVLNFWATWCAPCVEELPSLMAMQHTLPQVQVLAVSTDLDECAYKNFLVRHQVDLLSVRDGEQRANALYGTFRYPETYVIDREGVIRRKFIGPQDFSSPEILDFLRKLSA